MSKEIRNKNKKNKLVKIIKNGGEGGRFYAMYIQTHESDIDNDFHHGQVLDTSPFYTREGSAIKWANKQLGL